MLDPEGLELAPDGVERAALAAARDCTSGDVKSGKLDFRYSIDVHEENGKVVHHLPFADAVEVICS